MANPDAIELSVAPGEAGIRVDSYVSNRIPDCTRSYAAQLICQGHIRVDGVCVKPGRKIKTHEQISVVIPEPEPIAVIPEPIPLNILFEDRHLIVLNKPPGLVVHPAAGHASGTLVNGILHHCPNLEGIGGEMRPGIVHRLDKETSGVIVIAKTASALNGLSRQFKARSIEKRYLALIHGIPEKASGTIDLPVGRHPVDRKKMSTVSPRGREALTLWRIKEKYPGAALLEVDLKTGRTHQIRVHCKSMGHSIIGDTVYGTRKKMSILAKCNPTLYQAVKNAKRQMLHAYQLRFVHPVTAENYHFKAPLPEDMMAVIEALKNIS